MFSTRLLCFLHFRVRYDAREQGDHHYKGLPPKKKVRPSLEAVSEAKRQIQTGVKPSKIHKNMVLSAAVKDGADGMVTGRDVPTRKQISNYAHYMKRKELPTSDAIHNIIQLYGDNALLEVKLHPTIYIIISTPEQRALLRTHDLILAVDSTFDLVEGKLYVSTVMGIIEGIGVPLAWMVHNRTTQEAYAHYLTNLKNHTEMNPLAILRDFDLALENAAKQVFPRSRTVGDLWHFLHDNEKWLSTHGGKEHVSTAMITLRILWASQTHNEFALNLEDFISFWQARFPDYVTYFTKTWIATRPSSTWAAYTYGDDTRIPTGDQLWRLTTIEFVNLSSPPLNNLLIVQLRTF
jgi:hypothetical protein